MSPQWSVIIIINIIAALLLPLLNKNSSELSLPLFATALFGAVLQKLSLFWNTYPWNVLFKLSILLNTLFLNNHNLKIIVIEQLRSRKCSFYSVCTEVCMDWILDFLDPDSGFFQQDQEWVFLSCSRMRFGFGFCFYWKNITGCLIDLYLPRLKEDSDCLNVVGTGSGLDSDSQFAK